MLGFGRRPLRVEVRLCAALSSQRRGPAAFPVNLRRQATLGDLLRRLGLPERTVRLALCNGEPLLGPDGRLDLARPLYQGDHVVFAGAMAAAA